MLARKKIRLGRIALALCALVLSGVVVSGSGSSTNFELDQETNPTVAQDAWSPSYRMIGTIPGSPSGNVGISAQYRLHFDDLTPTSFLPDDLIPPVITVAPVVTYVSDTIALIEWQTDEPSDSVVNFGLTPAFGTTASAPGFVTLHQVLITTGLAPSTFYFFEAQSRDPYYNGPTASALLDFTTTATPDVTGPVVTPTVTFLATTVAKVDFAIDEMSQTVLSHGPTIALGTDETDLTWVVTRSRTFTGLTAGSTYYYALQATDPSGNATAGVVTGMNLPADVAIGTAVLPNAKFKGDYLETLVATGGVGALTFTVSAGTLPPGLTLSAAGVISGKPTKSGLYTFTVEATDSGTPASIDTQVLTIYVSKPSKNDEGCTTGDSGNSWLLLAGVMALLLAFQRRKRSRQA